MYSTSVLSCSKCGVTHDRLGQRLCHDCHAKSQRSYRARKSQQEAALKIEAKNQFEAAAREKKAQAIAACLWDSLKPEQRIDPTTLFFARESGQDARDIVAQRAGQRPPSEKCWARVLQILAQRVKDARWGFDRGRAIA